MALIPITLLSVLMHSKFPVTRTASYSVYLVDSNDPKHHFTIILASRFGWQRVYFLSSK